MGVSFIPLIAVVMVPMITGNFGLRVIGKRSTTDNDVADIYYPDYPAKYDDYPIIVPKRAALLLDRLMVALQKVVDNQGKGSIGSRGISRSSASRLATNPEIVSIAEDDQTVANSMDLQRRGQAKSQIYWRCYFNAVTCFKRK